MAKYDVVIVGAGFAGLSCAQAAAAQGVSTLVMERKSHPGATPHTTGILVKEAAQHWNFPTNLTRRIEGVRLYSPSLQSIDLHSPDYYFLATDTGACLDWLANTARSAGANIRTRMAYTSAQADGEFIRIARHNIQTRYLIGCDGARSRVARNFQLGKNQEFIFGVEVELRGVKGIDANHLHVFLDAQLAPGYIGWVVPGVGVHQIGLAVRWPAMPDLERFIAKLTRLFDFSSSETVSRRGGLIPCGGPVTPMTRGAVLLLGDAAGMVSPLTAGGIHAALAIGQVAGEALAQKFQGGTGDIEAEIRNARPNYFFKQQLRHVLDRIAPSNATYDRLIQQPLFRHLAQTIFFHQRGLFTWRAWQDILGWAQQ
ncbi:MAG: NAD(P)/FAD-dependent oxidoreductase [Gammaproteobacteria bacterium]|nr:NAD(P)/FAD-dependent oxidoreductase [Gammaproteobacteria bacterium]